MSFLQWFRVVIVIGHALIADSRLRSAFPRARNGLCIPWRWAMGSLYYRDRRPAVQVAFSSPIDC